MSESTDNLVCGSEELGLGWAGSPGVPHLAPIQAPEQA